MKTIHTHCICNNCISIKCCDNFAKGICYFYGFSILITIYTSIVYSVLGLINLSESKLDRICPDSNIRAIVTSWIIIILLNLYFFVKTDVDQSSILIICSIIQVTIYVVLGSYELWNIVYDCDKLHSKYLFLALQLIVYLNIVIIASIMVLILTLGLLYIYCMFDDLCKFYKKKDNQHLNTMEKDSIDVVTFEEDDTDNNSVDL